MKLAIVAAALGLLLPIATFGQALPGPAATGWYVVMGPLTPDLQRTLGGGGEYCHAMVLSADEANAVMSNSHPMYSKQILPQKKFGPFPTARHAQQELAKAGWQADFSTAINWRIYQRCP